MATVIESKKEIAKYQERFEEIFKNGEPDYISVFIGSKGSVVGEDTYEVMYFKKYNIWAVFSEAENRYWNAFGVGKPIENKNTSITCEINFPFEGIDRRIGGAFTKGEHQITLMHRGKIGGGRKGIGKSLFFNNYRGKSDPVSDGEKENELALIGTLNSSNFIQQVALFVKEVDRIKKHAEDFIEGFDDDDKNDEPIITDFEFKKEWFGKRTYSRKEIIEAECNHGIIVSELAKYLENKGFKVGNDNKRDLFTKTNNKIDKIFEVKTDLRNSSIYSAIGQVLMYSAEKNLTTIRKILVLPEKLKNSTEQSIAKLNLEILYYSFEDEKVDFIDIEQLLNR